MLSEKIKKLKMKKCKEMSYKKRKIQLCRLFSFLRKRPKESNTLENSEKLEKGNN
jgi:hypothetical protein